MEIIELQKKISKLNINKILKKIFQQNAFKYLIIDMNQEQLLFKGVDRNGVAIKTYKAMAGNVYSIRTIVIKQSKGQRTDIVTLRDTGKFYNTFRTKLGNDFVEITANFKKPKGNISDNLDTDNVLGLTEENKEELIKQLKPVFIEEFRRTLLE